MGLKTCYLMMCWKIHKRKWFVFSVGMGRIGKNLMSWVLILPFHNCRGVKQATSNKRNAISLLN